MVVYALPDLTGQDADFLQENQPLFITTPTMVIKFFNSPVYVDSLRIALTDRSGRTLDRRVDWDITDDDIDQMAMSTAFLEDPNFTGTLVNQIRLISSKALHKQVALTYQQFFQVNPNRSFDDGTPFEVTPDLIKTILSQQANIRQQVARVTSVVTPVLTTPALLEFDINGENPANLVTGEIVTVNTVSGGKVVRLKQGAFFADSVKMTYNGKSLDKGTDWEAIVPSPLLKNTTNKSGIYQYILILAVVTGDVVVDEYRAVGGTPQIDDIRQAYDLMVAIQHHLDNSVFVTEESLATTATIRALNSRQSVLEDKVRSLLSGQPTYGDTTTGDVVVRQITANDNNFHWWTIASLFQVQGSTDIVLADRFKGRIYCPQSKIAFAFSVDVNLTQTRKMWSVTTENLVIDPVYTLFGDTSTAAPVYPLLRLVWNQTGQAYSGLYLQFGMPLANLTDQMTVEDFSGTESCFLLLKPPTGQSLSPSPQDNNFTLPDGQSVWSNTSSSSHSLVAIPSFKDGYLIYTGSSVTLSTIAVQGSTSGYFAVTLPKYMPVGQVKEIVVTLASADSSQVYDVKLSLPTYQANIRSGRTVFSDSDHEVIELMASLSQDATSKTINLSLNATRIVTANGAANGSFSDVIRYVRAFS